MTADADTIYSRKTELPKEEIERQLEEYEQLSNTNKRFVKIDSRKTPDEMADEALRVVLEKYASRR